MSETKNKSRDSGLRVEKDMLVELDVVMSDLQKNVLESGTIVYLHGHNDIFPIVEMSLEHKKVGDKVHVQLEPNEAFGDFDENDIMIFDEKDFEGGVEVGLKFTSVRGQTFDKPYRVTYVADGKVVLDGNHPLAGYGIALDITVKKIEPAIGIGDVNPDVELPNFLSVGEKGAFNISDDTPEELN